MARDFFRGQPFNITEYVSDVKGNMSSYQQFINGRQPAEKTHQAPFTSTSIVNNVSPDPRTMHNFRNRRNKFSTDMTNMT